MAPKPDPKRDEPIRIEADFEETMKALLKVDPNSDPVTEPEDDARDQS